MHAAALLALRAADLAARDDLCTTFDPAGCLALIWAAHAAEYRARVAALSWRNGRRWSQRTLVRLSIEAQALQPDEANLHRAVTNKLQQGEARARLLGAYLADPGAPESWCAEVREHEELVARAQQNARHADRSASSEEQEQGQ